jgi:hypothetical protein
MEILNKKLMSIYYNQAIKALILIPNIKKLKNNNMLVN